MDPIGLFSRSIKFLCGVNRLFFTLVPEAIPLVRFDAFGKKVIPSTKSKQGGGLTKIKVPFSMETNKYSCKKKKKAYHIFHKGC